MLIDAQDLCGKLVVVHLDARNHVMMSQLMFSTYPTVRQQELAPVLVVSDAVEIRSRKEGLDGLLQLRQGIVRYLSSQEKGAVGMFDVCPQIGP